MDTVEWTPPPDPDFEKLAQEGLASYRRDKPAVVAFDTETTGLQWSDQAFCVTAAWRGKPGMVTIGTGPGPKNVMCSDGVVRTYSDYKRIQQEGIIQSAYIELALYDGKAVAREVLAGAKALVGHNIKFDLHRACNGDLISTDRIDQTRLHDTDCMAHLEDEHRSKKLKDLAVSVLGVNDVIKVPIKSKPGEFKEVPREKWEIEQAKKWAKKEYGLGSVADVGYHILPRGTVVPYAIKDAEFTLDLAKELWPRITRYPELREKYEQEIEVTRVLIELEAHGLGVDEEYVDEQVGEYLSLIMDDQDTIAKIVGKPVRTGKVSPKERALYFNPQSNTDIAAYFKNAGIDRPSYDAEVLEQLDNPMAQAILDLRGHGKTLNTYFMGLKKGTIDGVFHPSIRQHGTVSGRTSSGKERGDG